jgi:hypothetical protein
MFDGLMVVYKRLKQVNILIIYLFETDILFVFITGCKQRKGIP